MAGSPGCPGPSGSPGPAAGRDVPGIGELVSHARAEQGGRLDVALVAAGLSRSRNRAAREIRAGRVTVDGTPVTRASAPVAAHSLLCIEEQETWVARSAHKLLGALEDAALHRAPTGAVCLDAGASTGGFTQVLLAHGAAAVHAVDVGHGQLMPGIAEDPRVNDLPGTNVRSLGPAVLRESLAGRASHQTASFHADGTVDLVVADLSFISLGLVLDGLLSVCRPGALLGLMVKPQFEVGRERLGKDGVVTRVQDRADAVLGVVEALADAGAQPLMVSASRLSGPAGNREAFVWARAAAVVTAPDSTVLSVSVAGVPGRAFSLRSDPRAAVTAAVSQPAAPQSEAPQSEVPESAATERKTV